jgi:molybdopterin-binding protein
VGLSARRRLSGDAQVAIGQHHGAHSRVSVHFIESIIRRHSVDEFGLKKGDSVRAVIKSTEVMIQKD